MTRSTGAHTNRPELVAVHGIELLTTGRITLPVPEPHRGCLRAIRHGQIPLLEAHRRRQVAAPRELEYWARLAGQS
jgi:hypothetical protein